MRMRSAARLARRALTAGAIAALGLGVSAGAAQAISIDGITGNPFRYAGVSTTPHRFTIARRQVVVTCTTAEFTGTTGYEVEPGVWVSSDATDFQPHYPAPRGGSCTVNVAGIAFPANITVSGPWRLVAETTSGGNSTGRIELPSGNRTTIEVPLLRCRVYVDGPQTFRDGVNGSIGRSRTYFSRDGPEGELLTVFANGVVYTVESGDANWNRCPFSGGSDGTYETGDDGVDIPGVVVNP